MTLHYHHHQPQKGYIGKKDYFIKLKRLFHRKIFFHKFCIFLNLKEKIYFHKSCLFLNLMEKIYFNKCYLFLNLMETVTNLVNQYLVFFIYNNNKEKGEKSVLQKNKIDLSFRNKYTRT